MTATTAKPIVLVVALLLLVAPLAADAQPAGKVWRVGVLVTANPRLYDGFVDGPGVTAATALLAVEGAVAALELPDFMFSGKPSAADFIANSVIAKAIVLGSAVTPLRGLDLAAEEVVYEHNGEIAGTYSAAEVMGDPLNAFAWLANHLETRGLALNAGDVIMSGAISKMLRPKVGDAIRARFSRLGSVSINVVP